MTAGRMIQSLTTEQRCALAEHREAWIASGLSTQPANRQETTRSVRQAYAVGGLSSPAMVWVDSPLGVAYAMHIFNRLCHLDHVAAQVADQVGVLVRNQVRDHVAAQVADQVAAQVEAQVGNQVRDQMWDQVGVLVGVLVRDQVRDQVRAQVADQVRAQVADQVRDQMADQVGVLVAAQVGDQVGNQVGDQVAGQVGVLVRDQVRDQVRAQMADQVRAQVADQVRDQVRDQMWAQVGVLVEAQVGDQVRDQVRAQVAGQVRAQVGKQQISPYQFFSFGQFASASCAFYSFFEEICGLAFNPSVCHLAQIARHSGPGVALRHLYVACERPTSLFRDREHRLHCPTDFAIRYPDGWGVYALHGVRMEPWQVLTPPQDLVAREVLAVQNVEQRKELIRRMGIERFMANVGATVKDTQGTYSLLEVWLSEDIPRARFLKMRNPSVGLVHIEGVHPTCQTVQQAINWRAGHIDEHWEPTVLT